jgi:hypothetical protein
MQLDLGLNLSTKRTPRREFLDELHRVVPWPGLVDLIEPGRHGRAGVDEATQRGFGISDRGDPSLNLP